MYRACAMCRVTGGGQDQQGVAGGFCWSKAGWAIGCWKRVGLVGGFQSKIGLIGVVETVRQAGRILELRRASRGCWEKVGLAGVVGGGEGLQVGVTGRYQARMDDWRGRVSICSYSIGGQGSRGLLLEVELVVGQGCGDGLLEDSETGRGLLENGIANSRLAE